MAKQLNYRPQSRFNNIMRYIAEPQSKIAQEDVLDASHAIAIVPNPQNPHERIRMLQPYHFAEEYLPHDERVTLEMVERSRLKDVLNLLHPIYKIPMTWMDPTNPNIPSHPFVHRKGHGIMLNHSYVGFRNPLYSAQVMASRRGSCLVQPIAGAVGARPRRPREGGRGQIPAAEANGNASGISIFGDLEVEGEKDQDLKALFVEDYSDARLYDNLASFTEVNNTSRQATENFRGTADDGMDIDESSESLDLIEMVENDYSLDLSTENLDFISCPSFEDIFAEIHDKREHINSDLANRIEERRQERDKDRKEALRQKLSDILTAENTPFLTAEAFANHHYPRPTIRSLVAVVVDRNVATPTRIMADFALCRLKFEKSQILRNIEHSAAYAERMDPRTEFNKCWRLDQRMPSADGQHSAISLSGEKEDNVDSVEESNEPEDEAVDWFSLNKEQQRTSYDLMFEENLTAMHGGYN